MKPLKPVGSAAQTPDADFSEQAPSIAFSHVVTMLLAAVAGALAAVAVLPSWLPNLSASLLGSEPKAYWYLARSSAFVSYILLWMSMAFGVLITNRLSRVWPGGPIAFDLHQHTSLLGLAFALFHGLILLGDRYIQATPAQILIPFAYSGFEPFWVGLGQLALYGMAVVGLSFYVKDRLGRKTWRALHFLSFVIFGLALLHGIFSGTDSASPVAQVIYWGSGAILLLLIVYRVLLVGYGDARRRSRHASP